ncbi:MAG: hypothetical protein GEV05_27185 [Betaproteobacteria bacterium]|nr:hypothetical protein [Betaproteobacteria bacterium]
MRRQRSGWTQERRARQSALVRSWRPWGRSTGPRTDEGKARSSLNAWKHGARSAEALRELDMAREQLR